MPAGIVPTTNHMSSQEIADLTHGIPDVKPKSISDVHRSVAKILKSLGINSVEIDDAKMHHVESIEVYHVTDKRGYVERYYLNRRLTEVLITGWSVQIRAKVIDRLHELENSPAQLDLHTVQTMITTSITAAMGQMMAALPAMISSTVQETIKALPSPDDNTVRRQTSYAYCRVHNIHVDHSPTIASKAMELATAQDRRCEIDRHPVHDVYVFPVDLIHQARKMLNITEGA